MRLHHARRTHEPRNAENLRGSIALEGAAASILQTLKEGDDIHIKCLKQKDIPPPDNLRLTLYPIGESAALFDNIPGERPITPNMLQVLETLGGFPDCSATPTQLKEACSGHIAKSSYYAALNRLVRMGPHPRIQEDQARAVQHPEQDRAQYMD
jgi:hypothetical protein